jgi:valyl-tRNA synthetase
LGQILEAQKTLVSRLARLGAMTVAPLGPRPKSAATFVIEGATVFVPLEGVIDIAKEVARQEKELARLEKEIVQVGKKLQNEDFLAKAPADVVEKNKQRHNLLDESRQKVQATLARIKEMA